METKVTPLSSAAHRSFPHPSPLPPAKKPVKDTLSSLKQEETGQDPINGLFLAQLTQIFAKKYALDMTSSRLLDPSSDSSEEIREKLRRMLKDLQKVQKWTESTIRQTEKALQEPNRPASLQPEAKYSSPLKQFLHDLRAWFKRISTI